MTSLACKRHQKFEDYKETLSHIEKKWCLESQQSAEIIVLPGSNKEKLKLSFPYVKDEVIACNSDLDIGRSTEILQRRY